MKRRFGFLVLALVIAMSAVPAFAATEGNTTVKINADATIMDITVPSELVMSFNADGTNTLPQSFTIKNNSLIAGVHVDKIEMTGEGDWKLLPEAANAKELAANTKHIKFSIGLAGDLKMVVPAGDAADAEGSYDYTESDITLAAEESKVLAMAVERAAFTQEVPVEDAFAMAMYFAFN